MEFYEESLATKGRKQLDHLLADSDLVIPKLRQKVTIDSGLAKPTQDKMGSPEPWVF